MTRGDLEKAIYKESHNLDFQFIPWSNKRVIDFAVKQVDAALHEAERLLAGSRFVPLHGIWKCEEAVEVIRALKVGEK